MYSHTLIVIATVFLSPNIKMMLLQINILPSALKIPFLTNQKYRQHWHIYYYIYYLFFSLCLYASQTHIYFSLLERFKFSPANGTQTHNFGFLLSSEIPSFASTTDELLLIGFGLKKTKHVSWWVSGKQSPFLPALAFPDTFIIGIYLVVMMSTLPPTCGSILGAENMAYSSYS